MCDTTRGEAGATVICTSRTGAMTGTFATLTFGALVPTFLVPLAFVLHVISLWQLLGGTWVPHLAARSAPSR